VALTFLTPFKVCALDEKKFRAIWRDVIAVDQDEKSKELTVFVIDDTGKMVSLGPKQYKAK